MTAEQLAEVLALHEATHAALALAYGFPLHRVTIEPDIDTGWLGVTSYGAPGARATFEDKIVLTLAACVLTARMTKHPVQKQVGYHKDYAQAVSVAERHGIAAADVPALLERLSRRAEVATVRHWPKIRRLALALLEKRTLTGAEARAIAEEAPCPANPSRD
jgi:hypothetical protein